MKTLALALQTSEDVGTALPSVFPSLEKMGVKHRRGQLSLIAAGPGTGKSALAAFIAAKMGYGEFNETGVPTLYFSADTDKRTLGNRIAAAVTRFTVDEAEELLFKKNENVLKMLNDYTNHIWFDWNAGPNLNDIEDEIEAFAHVNGDWPHLIIVDNLKNIWVETSGEGGEHIRYDRVLDYLHELAALTNAHVMVLHHVTGYYENGDEPIPLSGILGKVSKPFRLILTLHKPNENQIGLSVVKNSSGKMDPKGGLICYLDIDLARQQFMDPSEKDQTVGNDSRGTEA